MLIQIEDDYLNSSIIITNNIHLVVNLSYEKKTYKIF
jgi:hypothetical protein